MVDLSHAYGGDTLYWPTDTTGFQLETLAEGPTRGGYFYAAREFATAEHGGTHLDAPSHFAEGGADAAAVPLERLILPGIVIDVAEAAAADADYQVTPEDVLAWEAEHGPVPAGVGGADQDRLGRPLARRPRLPRRRHPGRDGQPALPGIGADATRLLVEDRGVGLLGIDTASIDHGPSTDFIAHQIGAAAGVPNLENLADLSGLPPTGFLLAALPMKIENGTGAPVRAVAFVPPR